MRSKDVITIIIPSVFSWLLASLLLLIYSFDILKYIESSPNPFAGMGLLILGFLLVVIILILYFTGYFLDKKPEYLRRLVITGLIGTSLSVISFVILIDSGVLMLISLIGLVFFFGILLTSSGTLFAGLTNMWNRGRTYSYIIFIFTISILSSILLGGAISSRFEEPNLLSYSWVCILSLIGLFGVILSAGFFMLTRDMGVPWRNDAWPTQFKKIIGRRSVRAHLLTHFFIYLMIGISIASFSRIGDVLFTTSWLPPVVIPSLGEFILPKDKTFWFIVLIGDLVTTLPAGYYADKYGRKNLMVTAIYGIVFGALIFGLEKTPEGFLVAGFITGVSFALLHPTLDSSLWADLSPRDGLGRYYALGFISLAIGIGLGSVIGHWVITPTVSNAEIITYILVILAILAAFPLFWVADSFRPLDFTLLLVIEEGGLPIFDYNFNRNQDFPIELTLLSGALTAVGSFMSETLKEKGELNLVRHGSRFIITDKLEGIAAAIFSNKQDPELQNALNEFLKRFCDRYREDIKTWDGTREHFEGALDIAEEVFGHLAPSTNLEG